MLGLARPQTRYSFVRTFTHSWPSRSLGNSGDRPSNTQEKIDQLVRDNPNSQSLWGAGKSYKSEEEALGPGPGRKGQSLSEQHSLRDPTIYGLHIKASPNNTITSLVGEKGNVIAWASGGRCGFKHVQRSTYEAGYQCALRMIEAIRELEAKDRDLQLELIYKGFGKGRQAVTDAITGTEGGNIRNQVVRISDRTPIKIGGNKAKKTRRL